jgi:hypothetical protein
MPDRIFQIFGATIPPLIGRKVIMARLWNSLTKPTPDHLQVIGPRFAGKSSDQIAAIDHRNRPEWSKSQVCDKEHICARECGTRIQRFQSAH